MSVGRRIRQAREAKGITQDELGKRCGTTKQTIFKYENGIITNIPLDRLERIAEILEVLPEDLMGWNRQDEIVRPVGKIALLGRIACGSPILAEENIEEYITLPSGIRADYVLRCRGDSMVEAGIRDGDIVFIRQTPDVDDGQIAAVRLGDDATLKRVFHLQDGVMLMAEDKERTRRTFIGSQRAEMEIMGQAVAYLHKLV